MCRAVLQQKCQLPVEVRSTIFAAALQDLPPALSALLTSLLGSSSLPGRAGDTTKPLSGFISPPSKNSFHPPPSLLQLLSYLRGGTLRFLSSLFSGVFGSPDLCRYMEG